MYRDWNSLLKLIIFYVKLRWNVDFGLKLIIFYVKLRWNVDFGKILNTDADTIEEILSLVMSIV